MELLDKLSEVLKSLNNWAKDKCKGKKIKKEGLQQKLAILNKEDPSEDILGEILDVKIALNLEADKEEAYWEQRARAN